MTSSELSVLTHHPSIQGHQNIEGLEKELRAFFRTDVTVTLDQEGKVHARKTQTGENIDLLYDNKDIAAGPGEQMLYVLMFSREIVSQRCRREGINPRHIRWLMQSIRTQCLPKRRQPSTKECTSPRTP